jgi:hypothetical protein
MGDKKKKSTSKEKKVGLNTTLKKKKDNYAYH